MAKTTDKTMAQTIESLLNDHVENHDPEIPHVMGRIDGSEANINKVELSASAKTYPTVNVELSDGTRFAIRVQQLQSN